MEVFIKHNLINDKYVVKQGTHTMYRYIPASLQGYSVPYAELWLLQQLVYLG